MDSRKRILHLRQAFDGGPDEFQHFDALRLFGPAGKGGVLDIARQADAAGHDDAVMRSFAARASRRVE